MEINAQLLLKITPNIKEILSLILKCKTKWNMLFKTNIQRGQFPDLINCIVFLQYHVNSYSFL